MSVPFPTAFRQIEEAGLRAWPAARQLLYDGWVVRISDGYTNRANSATLLYRQETSLHETTLRQIEAIYRTFGRAPIFRIVSFNTDDELERRFAERGYHVFNETLVMSRQVGPNEHIDSRIFELDFATGLANHARMNDLSDDAILKHRAILERIPFGCSFFGLYENDMLAACGLMVIDGAYAGLFDIVTDPMRRRQGYGAELVKGMLARAASNGVQTAYLQVVGSNEPAVALYRSAGFDLSYRYRYRVTNR